MSISVLRAVTLGIDPQLEQKQHASTLACFQSTTPCLFHQTMFKISVGERIILSSCMSPIEVTEQDD